MAAGRHLNRPSRLQCEPSYDKSATPEEHKCRRGRASMPLPGPPLNEPVDLRRLLRTGLETKPDEMALVSAEEGHT